MRFKAVCHVLLALPLIAGIAWRSGGGADVRAAASAAMTATTTGPVARESAAGVKNLTQLVAQLADSDPSRRAAARDQLMALSPSDLPLLRRAIAASVPLRPGEIDALRDIVTQVYLSGDDAPVTPNQGFMGLKMRSDEEAIHSEDDSDPSMPLGVVVEDRVPGFPAYRLLRNGDLILAISKPGGDVRAVRSVGDIIDFVTPQPPAEPMHPGDAVQMVLLRSGKHVDVRLTLSARPEALQQKTVDVFNEFRAQQLQKASEYWQSQFAGIAQSVRK